MEWILNLLSGGLTELVTKFGGYILGGIGLVIGAFILKRQGAKEQAQKDTIATQQETINAHKDRDNVEDSYRRASPDERDRMQQPWLRD